MRVYLEPSTYWFLGVMSREDGFAEWGVTSSVDDEVGLVHTRD